MRTIKTVVGGERYLYYYSGDKLISMTWDDGGRSFNFLYNGASPYSVVYYDGTYSTSYYYITNLQGDVVAIMNAQHVVVAEYVYDAWGNILAITDSNGSDISGNAAHIANLNPIRYRGYFYDTETGFYYLQSRYYDPVIGRFINADGYMSTGQGFSGCNMYSYCANNPVIRIDSNGKSWYSGMLPKIAGASWGLFTPLKNDARNIAISLGNGLPPAHDSAIMSGYFNHYHVNNRTWNGYKHFHIWYTG